STLATMAPMLSRRRILTRTPADLPLVELDAPLFQRVLVNLLDNAVKYTPPGSTILIGAEASDQVMHVVVEDDGPGLPELDAERLFEPFTRGQTESSIAGVGLGLALCRTIIEAHDGTIRAERRQPNGARFEIRLPLGCPPDIETEGQE